MSDDFDAFNEQVETEPGADEREPDGASQGGTSRFETEVREVAVVGENNDRLRASAENPEGTQVDYEMDSTEAGRVMSLLDIADARELEGKPVLVWEDEDGEEHLDFEAAI